MAWPHSHRDWVAVMCPYCYDSGRVTDPQYAELVVASLMLGSLAANLQNEATEAIDTEIEAMRKASGKTGRYWMVGDCNHKGGTL